jgi:glycosyltransferase involved in cell wall biosynthesis
MNILFVHDGIGQFRALHQYYLRSGLANSWLACSKPVYLKNKDTLANLLPFIDATVDEHSYYYIRRLEQRIKRSFGIKKLLEDFLQTQTIDVMVVHGTGGFPLQLFDEFSIPIVTYIEFPSYAQHGNDPRYPPPDAARFVDKLFEMTSFHQVLKSRQVIVPSNYAKRMFPEALWGRITVQPEGFEVPELTPAPRAPGPFRIGFAARDLSSAKGFEDFIQIAKKVAERLPEVEFHLCGGKKTFYGYENEFLKRQGSGPEDSFFDYILRRENVELGTRFKYHGSLPHDAYQAFLSEHGFDALPPAPRIAQLGADRNAAARQTGHRQRQLLHPGSHHRWRQWLHPAAV